MPTGFDFTVLALMPALCPHTFPLPVPFFTGTRATLLPLLVAGVGAGGGVGGGVCNIGCAGGGQAGCRGPTSFATFALSSMIV